MNRNMNEYFVCNADRFLEIIGNNVRAQVDSSELYLDAGASKIVPYSATNTTHIIQYCVNNKAYM